MMAEQLQDWMTVSEAARLKGVAEHSVRLAIRSGRLAGEKVGRSYRVRRHDVESWAAARKGAIRPGRGAASPQILERALGVPASKRPRSAEEIRAALSQFTHLRVSTEKYLQHKRSEIAQESTGAEG
jgi:excisionase family DNA binding protein